MNVDLAHETRPRPWPQTSHLVMPDGSVADCADQQLAIVMAQATVEAWDES